MIRYIPDGALMFFSMEGQQLPTLKNINAREGVPAIEHNLRRGQSTICQSHADRAICVVVSGVTEFLYFSTSRYRMPVSVSRAIVIPRGFCYTFEAVQDNTKIIGVVGEDFVRAVLASAEPAPKTKPLKKKTKRKKPSKKRKPRKKRKR